MPNLMALYRDLHANPELSMQETRSAARMAEEARRAGFTVTTGVGGTGVVAVMENGPGPVLLLRADMDALPVEEQTGLAFASRARGTDPRGPGDRHHARLRPRHPYDRLGRHGAAAGGDAQPMVGHAGHDRPARRGDQPGRQGDARGRPVHPLPAPDPRHRLPRFGEPAGRDRSAIRSGRRWPMSIRVDIMVRGVGGHGAYPHTTRDPIVLASRIVTTLQTLVSRELDPLDCAVVTVGSFQAGTKHNIISDEARLQLTVRSYTPEVRRAAARRHRPDRPRRGDRRRHARGPDAGGHRARGRGDPGDGQHRRADPTAPLARFRQHFGEARVQRTPPVMGGEDFGRFHLADPRIESLIFWVGGVPQARWDAANGDAARLPSLHSPFWAPDAEAVISTATEAMTVAAMGVLRRR